MLFITVQTGKAERYTGLDETRSTARRQNNPSVSLRHNYTSNRCSAASDAVKMDCDLSLDNTSNTQRTKVLISADEWLTDSHSLCGLPDPRPALI